MVLDTHTKLGIAQTVFYLPIVPLALYLVKRNGRYPPRMAWFPICLLSLMRLVGGPLTIAFQWHESIGLAIAALVLLNVGTVPLIATNLGLARAVFQDNDNTDMQSGRLRRILHLLLAPPAALLAAGGGLRASQPNLAKILTLVGYAFYAVLLVLIIMTEVAFWSKKEGLIPSSRLILMASFSAAPFVAVRIAYGILEVASSSNTRSMWNPLSGSALVFGLVALLPEYAAICIYMVAGYSIPPDRGVPKQGR